MTTKQQAPPERSRDKRKRKGGETRVSKVMRHCSEAEGGHGYERSGCRTFFFLLRQRTGAWNRLMSEVERRSLFLGRKRGGTKWRTVCIKKAGGERQAN